MNTKTEIGIQTNPQSLIGLFNLKQKKKRHNITIDNNRREPTAKPDVRYTEKQRYRKYKTKIEPALLNKIEANADDDIVNKIKEAFGLSEKKIQIIARVNMVMLQIYHFLQNSHKHQQIFMMIHI